MADDDKQGHLSRRTLLIGGGAGVGLLVAWAVWPRTYAPNLTAARGEHIMGAWLKIGEDGHIVVAVPQAEHGQGVYTTLPQIIADRSEEHTSELQSLMPNSYAVVCLQKK